MFEYYKWKLANKPIGKIETKVEAQAPLGKKVWGICLLLSIALSIFIVFAPLGGMVTLSISGLSAAVILVWLVTNLKNVKWKLITIKMLQFLGILIITTVILALLFGLISVITHNIMADTHHLGQIATTVDLITRIIILLLSPILIVMFFRFIDGGRVLMKIRRKTYLELLIVLALGLLISQLPNALVFRNLMLTHTIQFIIFTIINTLLITAVITTARHRGVLT